MPPAARLTDMHTCPEITGAVPHVGGPIIGPGVATVLIGNKPAAVLGDNCVCIGPPSVITEGSSTVFIGGKPAARMGDKTNHDGTIVAGLSTVLIGG
ncbi:MAG: PAAR domain-containing protein [Pseudomonadota bacterium]